MEKIIKNLLKDENLSKEFKNVFIKNEKENKILKQINLYRQLEENSKEQSTIMEEIWKNSKEEGEWRNTKFEYWRDICLKYDEEKLLNCYGDIFYIDEVVKGCYIGRRVLWNLGLSKEQYCIEEYFEDDDREFDISVKMD